MWSMFTVSKRYLRCDSKRVWNISFHTCCYVLAFIVEFITVYKTKLQFTSIIKKKDRHTKFWIKRFSAPSFFSYVQLMLKRKIMTWPYYDLKEKYHIRRKINCERTVCLWNQYYYFDLPKIRVCWACTTKY